MCRFEAAEELPETEEELVEDPEGGPRTLCRHRGKLRPMPGPTSPLLRADAPASRPKPRANEPEASDEESPKPAEPITEADDGDHRAADRNRKQRF